MELQNELPNVRCVMHDILCLPHEQRNVLCVLQEHIVRVVQLYVLVVLHDLFSLLVGQVVVISVPHERMPIRERCLV